VWLELVRVPLEPARVLPAQELPEQTTIHQQNQTQQTTEQ
jgi:hypothetical protein